MSSTPENAEIDLLIKAVTRYEINEVQQYLKEGEICINGKDVQLSAQNVEELYKKPTGKVESINDIRKKFKSFFKKMAGCPIPHENDECIRCSSSDTGETTFPVTQELFLWSLQETDTHSMDMAVLLWSQSKDKISCACIGWAVKTEMMKLTNELEQKWIKLDKDAKVFQQLAISTLKGCHDESGDLTRSLLRKQCPWWNDLSVLQIVVGTENMEFLAQPACEKHMTELWLGFKLEELNGDNRFQTLVDAPAKDVSFLDLLSTRVSLGYLSWPVVRYSMSLILHLVFLGVYSFVLLFSFNRTMTKTFYVLIVWVADIAASELRQALNPNPRNNAPCFEVNEHCKSYWKQKWNWLDVLTIALFAVGMLVFAQNEVLHIIGRTVLSIDLFFFCIRMLQLLMVFKELGLLLVMVKKMIKDTVNFMFILLVFVSAFAVSSEAILYSKRQLDARHVFLILRKAYWQVFGELFLDEISLSAKDNDTASSICTDPPCPTTYGQYSVPIMLGFYVMVTNVLLLNLLIARFNKTFEEVHDQAISYQSWHRAMIIIEYHDRPHLPPPFNILRLVYGCIQSCIITCFVCCIICKENKVDDENENENENKNELEKKITVIKEMEDKHARNALQETRPSVFQLLARSGKNQNSESQTKSTLSKMEEQLHTLLQEITQIRNSIQE